MVTERANEKYVPEVRPFLFQIYQKILLLLMERPLDLNGLVSFRFLLVSVLLLLTRGHSLHIVIHGSRTMKGLGFHLTWSSKHRCPSDDWEIRIDMEFHGSVMEIKPTLST